MDSERTLRGHGEQAIVLDCSVDPVLVMSRVCFSGWVLRVFGYYDAHGYLVEKTRERQRLIGLDCA